ncbi:hypothetical protein [Paraconexibacter algicola]|uniref:hypothetical protein n=1 Tax=Paraconexibacter algicola TaxID=2133960 RepID=UPI0018EE484F|nr:hypothetical protein [Paraconexibacter algicola]
MLDLAALLVQAPRSEPAVLDACRYWLTLFPFLTTGRRDAYAPLARPRACSPTPPSPRRRPPIH